MLFSLGFVALIIAAVSAITLFGIFKPDIFKKWPQVAWFTDLVDPPAPWLFSVAVIGLVIGAPTVIHPLLGLLAAAFIVAGYLKPELMDKLAGKDNNFFRGPRWWSMIHPPFWLQIVMVVVPSLVLGVEVHPLVVVLVGAYIFGSTWAPELFDFLGAWNVTRWKEIRFIGGVMSLLGFGWAIHSLRFEGIVVLMAVAYVWAKRTGWIDKAKAFAGLA
jgi:hypothetical protein